MVCLETSFIVDLLRGDNEIKLIAQNFDKIHKEIFITTPSIAEIVKGAYLSAGLDKEMKKIYELISSFIILNLDKESAILAGKIEAELTKKGEIIDIEDIMIGAIAVKNNETLITRNIKHFEKISELKVERY
ncbi:MAG: PIN domain-containing protein [Nanoarchaeota archaeon]